MKNKTVTLTKTLSIIACSLTAAMQVLAASDTWIGNTDANWSTAANWSSAPAASGDLLFFGVAGTSGSILNNDLVGYSFSGIIFNSGATATNLTGNAFTLAGGITNNSTSIGIINNNITLAGNETVNAAGGSPGFINLGGIVSDGGAGYGLTFLGLRNFTISGANTYNGPTTNAGNGVVNFAGTGSMANSDFYLGVKGNSVASYGAVTPTSAGTTVRTKSFTFNGAAMGGNNYHSIIYNGTSAGNTIEQFGNLTLGSGMFEGSVAANSAANVQLDFNSVTRNPGTSFYFGRSTTGIGANPIANQTANAANIVFTTPPTLVGGGGAAGSPNISIIPWADLGSGNRVTYDSTYGLRGLGTGETVPLTASGFVGSDGTTNVTTAAVTLTGNSAVNSIAGGGTIGLGGFTLTVSSGMIIAGTSSTIGSAANDGFLALGQEGHFFSENARVLTVNSCITGTGGLTIALDDLNGTGAACTLTGTNTFSGVTTVEGNNAAMRLNVNNALALQNSTLDYNNYGASVAFGGGQTYYVLGGLKGAQNMGMAVPFIIGGDGDSTIYSGILSGAGSLAKVGTGAFTLNAANTYSGGTILSNGVLNINYGGSSSANSAIGVGALTIAGGSIDNTSGSAVTLAPNNAQNWNGDFTFIGTGSLNLGTGLVSLGSSRQVTVNANTLTVGGAISGTGFGLTKNGNGTLALSGANTYSGDTTINGGTLALTGSGSVASSPNITVASGATFDVSAISFTIGGSQNLLGSGTNNGAVGSSSGSKIYAGTDGTYGTNTFNNNLTLASGAAAYLDLGTTTNGANDKIVVGGTLTLNGNTIHIKAPSSSVNLDANDYTLFTVSGTISGSFAVTPTWDVQPLNSGHYTIVTSGNTVKLHYSAVVVPAGTGSAAPNPVNRNQSTVITVTVTTPGSSPVSTVTLNASPIGGSASVTLIEVGATSSYTNTVTVGSSVAAGSTPLSATITDTDGGSASVSVPLAVLAGAVTWNGNGADNNWTDTANWVSGISPLGGDAVTFAGTTRLTPLMDNIFSLSSVTFSPTAGSFVISNTAGNTLTLTGNGVTNNSANAQSLDMPIALSSAQTFNAAAGNIVLGGLLSGSSSITKLGTNALVLAGTNTYGGGTTVSAGTVVVANNSAFGSGAVTLNSGAISNAAGNSYAVPNNVTVSTTSSVEVGAGDTLTLSGTVSGSAALTKTGNGALKLPSANNISGGVAVNGGTLVVANNNAAGTSLLTLGNASISNSAGSGYTIANTVNLSGAANVEVGAGDTFTLSGIITNGGSLTKTANGTLTIAGTNPNTYSGGTTISAGFLDVENTSISPIGTGILTFAGGSVECNGGSPVTVSNNIYVVTNTTTALHPTGLNGNGMTFAGNISGGGNIVVDGSSSTFDSFVLSGTNSGFTGTFTVNNSANQRFAFGSPNAGSPNAAFVFNSVGVDNQKFVFGTGTISFGSLSGPGQCRNDFGNSVTTIRIGDLNTSTIFNGLFVGNGNAQFSLLKVGTGTLTMTNNNTYSGVTEVAGGELMISVLQGNAHPFIVDDGATLGVTNFTGSGLYAQPSYVSVGNTTGGKLHFANLDNSGSAFGLIVTSTLTNNGTCTVVITDTNNIVAGNTYNLILYGTYVGTGGTSGSGDFVLSSPYVQGYVTNDVPNGQVALVVTGITSVNPNPTNITTTVSGNNLILSWPADHTGWLLQAQTNSIGTGLGTNWVTIPGTDANNSYTNAFNPANGSVFYRMVLP